MDQKIETSGECIQRKAEDQCHHQRPCEFVTYFKSLNLASRCRWLSNNWIQLNTNASVKWEIFLTFYFAGNRNGGARFCQRKEICGSRVWRSENLLARPGKS